MNPIYRYVGILFIQVATCALLQGQIWLSNEDIYNEAEEYLNAEEYIEALPLYLLLEQKEIINANVSYKIGECYLNIRGRKHKSIPYLESAVENVTSDYKNEFKEQRAPLRALLLLGVAYRINNEPDVAINTFRILGDSIHDTDPELMAIVDMHIKRCENAKLLGAFPGEPRTFKLSERINTKYSDYNPVLVGLDSILYYMEELPFYDALMRSEMLGDDWDVPQNMTPVIGSDGDHILVGASADGKTLLLYLYEPLKAGEIYVINQTDDGWQDIVPLNENINTQYNETHASLSYDGKTLYFTSNRPGGYGGLDIYMSKLDENNDWGTAVNIGPTINTAYNEECPIITSEDDILYFSSQGHLNMGGYDVYYAQRKAENKWRQPINMGSPVSTTDDDLFYYPLESEVSGLMSRLEQPYNTGYDIYRYNSMVFPNTPRYSVKGNANDIDSTNTEKEVVVIDVETSDTLLRKSPGKDGSYEFILPAGNFTVAVVNKYGEAYFAEIDLNNDPIESILVSKMTGEAGKISEGSALMTLIVKDTVVIKNILFGFDTYSFISYYKPYLESVSQIMIDNPGLNLKITGYTDAIGSESYNLILSEKRANAVLNYFISKNIDRSRFKVFGKGEADPVAKNKNDNGTDCPEGRKYNRRVEIYPISDSEEVVIKNNVKIPPSVRFK
ncbi:MAG: OmpA family protein [Bacteroidales bacterium]|nr:OmpA family protein [Bacteroidales bacterium]